MKKVHCLAAAEEDYGPCIVSPARLEKRQVIKEILA